MQEVTETSTRVEDFEGLKEHVKELKNKYVKKKQQYGTATILRDIEKLSIEILEYLEPFDKVDAELQKKLDILHDKIRVKYGTQSSGSGTGSGD
jgi:hypothetical protein